MFPTYSVSAGGAKESGVCSEQGHSTAHARKVAVGRGLERSRPRLEWGEPEGVTSFASEFRQSEELVQPLPPPINNRLNRSSRPSHGKNVERGVVRTSLRQESGGALPREHPWEY